MREVLIGKRARWEREREGGEEVKSSGGLGAQWVEEVYGWRARWV